MVLWAIIVFCAINRAGLTKKKQKKRKEKKKKGKGAEDIRLESGGIKKCIQQKAPFPNNLSCPRSSGFTYSQAQICFVRFDAFLGADNSLI